MAASRAESAASNLESSLPTPAQRQPAGKRLRLGWCECGGEPQAFAERSVWCFGEDAEQLDARFPRQLDGSVLVCRECRCPVDVEALARKDSFTTARLKGESFERYFVASGTAVDGMTPLTAWRGPPALVVDLQELYTRGDVPSADALRVVFEKHSRTPSAELLRLRKVSEEAAAQALAVIQAAQNEWITASLQPPSVLEHISAVCEAEVHVLTNEMQMVGVFSSTRRANTAAETATYPGDGDVVYQTFALDKAALPLMEPPRVDVFCNSSAPSSRAPSSEPSSVADDDDEEEEEDEEEDEDSDSDASSNSSSSSE